MEGKDTHLEVLDIRLMPPGRPLKGFADIKLDGIVVREFRIIKENGRRLWVASPQISWKDPNGQIKYKTVITLPDELKGQIDLVILKRFTEEMEKNDAKQKR